MSSRDGRREIDMSLVSSVNRSRNGRQATHGRNIHDTERKYTHRKDMSDYKNSRDRNKNRSNSSNRDSNRGKYNNSNKSKNNSSYDYNDKGKSNEKNIKKKRKKKKHRLLKTLLISLIFIILGTFLAIKYVPGAKQFILTHFGETFIRFFVSEEIYKNIFDSEFDDGDIVVNDGVDRDKFKGYYTVALFGIDARDEKMGSGVNSDSIILLSINQDTGKIVMSSVYRDTWLQISSGNGDNVYRKINSAFTTGGAKSAINTMNTNFDLHISDYVTINFQGLATIVDMLGGIDLTITEDEKKYINSYMDENREVTGISSPNVTKSGNVHLDGLQTVAYCRIRYCTFYAPDGTQVSNDMGRTARQRHVLSLMIEKAKSAGVSKVIDIAKHMFNGEENIIKTSIAYDELMDMIPVFINFELGETKGFPFTYDFPDSSLTNGQSALVPGGLVYNVRQLHKFLYGIENYIPSDRVIKIDGELKKRTGIEDIR